MRNSTTLGVLIGLLFGVIFVWQGASDAAIVLLFALVGWIVGFVVLLVRRVLEGEMNVGEFSSFFDNVVNGPRR